MPSRATAALAPATIAAPGSAGTPGTCARTGRASRHDVGVVAESELLAAVDSAFVITGRGLAPWPDPHPDRSAREEEYSRLLNPEKWRIIGARAQAWLVAFVDTDLAVVEPNASVPWHLGSRPIVARTDRITPLAAGALPLVVAHSGLGTVNGAGVALGVGDPAVCVTWFPECGCDACDSGSQDELDDLDHHIVGIVSGAFRRLSDGTRTITVVGEGRWNASGRFERGEVEAILADPTEWDELAGASWLDTT